MPTHAEKKTLPYSPEQMFDLVLDVERYPEFLPWCLSCDIIKENEDEKFANLVIGYKVFREWIKCRVSYQHSHHIRVEYINGPLKYLSNTWDFMDAPNGGCVVDFYVDFEFKNPFFQKLMGVFFNEIVKRMVKAFEDRAKDLYGPKTKAKPPSKSKPDARPLRKKET
jgi:coenzyme Q-binding protein COQ10